MADYSTDIEKWKLPVFKIGKSFVKSIIYPLFYCSPGNFKFLQIDFKPIELFFNQNGPHWTGLDQTGTDRKRQEKTETDWNRPDWTRPEQTGADHTGPD